MDIINICQDEANTEQISGKVKVYVLQKVEDTLTSVKAALLKSQVKLDNSCFK